MTRLMASPMTRRVHAWRFWSSAFLAVAVAASCGNAGVGSSDPASSSTQPPASASADVTEPGDEYTPPDPGSLPVAIAPQSLGEVDLPDTEADIVALFDRLPTELVGGQRAEEVAGPVRFRVTYGTTEPVGCSSIGLQALDVSTGDFYPEGWTAEQVVSAFTGGADWDVEDFGHEEDLYWVRWSSTCSVEGETGEDVSFTTMWGQAGSPWAYSAMAGSPEVRDELTAAFVTAAS
jgi:hypothetical protein